MVSFSSLKYNRLLFIAIFLLFIVNLVQGYSTELIQDEAYYWVYSKFISWGYFDHPPMVAIWIWISNLFFNDELGVRFFCSITLSANIYLIWLLIDNPRKKEFVKLFLLVALSMFLFNVYGFIAVPDAPMLFFMTLFLLCYKRYLKKKSILNCVLIALSMTGMLYSKYPSILIIIFVLLSNISILKDYKIWLSALLTLLLFFPHLYWQYINDYPSFRYHLYERSSNSSFHFEYPLMHLVNLIAIIGLTFPLVYWAFFRGIKVKDKFTKALNFIVLGFAIFFFLMSFRGSTQAQWNVPISIPLIVITFNYLVENSKKRKLFSVLAIVSILISCVLRFIIATDILPIQLEMHGNKKWVLQLKKEIGNRKALFFNSYQNASLYWFYSKDTAVSYAHFEGRKNEYSLLELPKLYQGKNVAHVYGWNSEFTEKKIKRKNKDSIYISYIDNFQDVNYLHYSILDKEIRLKQNDINRLNVEIKNPYLRDIDPKSYRLFVMIRQDDKAKAIKIPAKTIIDREFVKSKSLTKAQVVFRLTDSIKKNKTIRLSFVGKGDDKIYLKRMSKVYDCSLK